jgi:FkbM family methyltransferase
MNLSNIRRYVRHCFKNMRPIQQHGIDIIRDIKRCHPRFTPAIIFDIGANIGQSTLIYLKRFPNTKVFAFEPALETFRILQTNTERKGAICHNIALSNAIGEVGLIHCGPSDNYRIDVLHNSKIMALNNKVEKCITDTVDRFSEHNYITDVDFMKIDTEGADLLVLQGARAMLSRGAVRIIQVEVGFHPENETHVSVIDVILFLQPFGYRVFGIYEQTLEFKHKKKYLRRVNMVFVHYNFA